MRVIVTATVKNEIDIIEAFVRHATRLAQQLVVLDNGSTDGTLDILRALQREGLPIDVVADPSLGQYQSKRMTELMHDYAVKRCHADWVMPLDADEFALVPPETSLIPEGAPCDRPLRLLWKTYLPNAADLPRELNPALRIRRRLEAERQRGKVIVPAALARLSNARLGQGNHGLLIGGRRCPAETCVHARLAHLPIRSPGQFASKTAIGCLQYLTMPDKAKKWGRRTRRRFELLKQDPATFALDLRSAVLSCLLESEDPRSPKTVEDPIRYLGGPLVHTPAGDEQFRAFRDLLAYAEELAERYAALVARQDTRRRARLDRPTTAGRPAPWHWPIRRLVGEPLAWLKKAMGSRPKRIERESECDRTA